MARLNTLMYLMIALTFLAACQSDGDGNKKQEKEVLNESSGDPAIDQVSAQIDERPGDAELYFERGQIYMDREVYSEAIRDFTMAMELQGGKAKYYEALADAYLNNNMSFDALEVMKDAYDAFPDSTQVGLKLAKYHLILEQYLASMNLTNKMIQENPGLADAYLFQGVIYREMETPLKAMEAFQTAVELDAGLTDAWIEMGEMMGEEDLDLASRFYQNAERSAPNELRPIHAHALFLHQNEQWGAAIAKYKEAHEKDPTASETFYNAGLLYLELDSLEDATAMFDIAVGNDPLFAKAYYYRGMAAEWQENWASALEDYQRAQQINPNIPSLSERIRELESQKKEE